MKCANATRRYHDERYCLDCGDIQIQAFRDALIRTDFLMKPVREYIDSINVKRGFPSLFLRVTRLNDYTVRLEQTGRSHDMNTIQSNDTMIKEIDEFSRGII